MGATKPTKPARPKKPRFRPYKATPHGTTTGYAVYGCRCPECVSASLEAGMRARAKRMGVLHEPYSRLEVYEDDPTCDICGEFVEWEDFTVDHVMPMSLGGPDIRANVASAHFLCNSTKGARVLDTEAEEVQDEQTHGTTEED